jgi:hypothetical protein
MGSLQQALITGTQAPPTTAVQSRSKRHPPLIHRAALRPSVPAGAQMVFVPGQSAALAQASDAHTLAGTTTGPPQVGSTGPRMHLPPGLPAPVQSSNLQHCPGGVEQVVASGTLIAHTRYPPGISSTHASPAQSAALSQSPEFRGGPPPLPAMPPDEPPTPVMPPAPTVVVAVVVEAALARPEPAWPPVAPLEPVTAASASEAEENSPPQPATKARARPQARSKKRM